MVASPDIVHRDAEGRFDARLEGHRGELRYVRREVEGRSVMVIPSVVVDRAIEGRGVAGVLTRAALEWAGAEGLHVEPVCPYVDAWMRRHPEFNGLRA
ncbi:GNAT family N-acetyltransferase [Silanimonas sp.]|jgi:predicted GNAT family acetyltransferase|uniref:GNAT family N-acetyltransferase n=1 Tax=Silanimonas sp. TaxID=1929290 RepID=UPI0022C55129|nr:GNAT family N-acetyltransferase [Silanimonas sp.]MCZ8063036.1 GNAT family N-acetyltransferase [Silanimonas sp.]